MNVKEENNKKLKSLKEYLNKDNRYNTNVIYKICKHYFPNNLLSTRTIHKLFKGNDKIEKDITVGVFYRICICLNLNKEQVYDLLSNIYKNYYENDK